MIKEQEIRAELYRVLKNSIEKSISSEDYLISSVQVEYPVGVKKADLVVFYQYMPRLAEHPLLVIETKRRTKHPAAPLANATKQSMSYAEKLNSKFFAVYDGWNFLLFRMVTPYLVKVSNFLISHIDESIARDLLLGSLEFYLKREVETLERLPKIPDGWSFQQIILPSIAKALASPEGWKTLYDHSEWFSIIHRDGEW